MPTIIGHPAVALASAMIGGRKLVPGRLLIAAIIVSMLPDADAVGFRLGIPYGHMMGHRGFSHSLTFALIVGLTGMLFASRLRASQITTFIVLFVAAISHGIFDAITNGGLGVAFFSPFSNERYFLPLQFIPVAPLSLGRMMTLHGWKVLQSEFIWLWLPSLTAGSLAMLYRKFFQR